MGKTLNLSTPLSSETLSPQVHAHFSIPQHNNKQAHTDKTKLKTVNTLIDELNSDLTASRRINNNNANNKTDLNATNMNTHISPSISNSNSSLSTLDPVVSSNSSVNYMNSTQKNPLHTGNYVNQQQHRSGASQPSFVNSHSDQTSSNNSKPAEQNQLQQLADEQKFIQQSNMNNSNSLITNKSLNYVSFKMDNDPSSSSVSSSSSNGINNHHSYIISQQQQHMPKIIRQIFPNSSSSGSGNLIASSTCLPSSSGSVTFINQAHFQESTVQKTNFLGGDESESISANS